MTHPCIADIMILLHYYTTPGPYRSGDPDYDRSTTVSRGHAWLKEQGLIEPGPKVGNSELAYCTVTEKGRCWVEAIASVPLPVRSWTIPKEKNDGCG